MPHFEHSRVMKVDFAKAAQFLPYLERDMAALDKSVSAYLKNYLKYKAKFTSLFHSCDAICQPNRNHPLNQAAENLELSHLIKLYEIIANETAVTNSLRRLERNNDHVHISYDLLAAYVKYFSKSDDDFSV